MKKFFDDYTFKSNDETSLLNEVQEMERNSEWYPGVISNSIRLDSIDGPICAEESARKYALDPELTRETAESGTKLILDAGKAFLLRDTAWASLLETAKLNGSALGRMSPYKLKETLNYGLEVARGNSLVLIRYGKASAVHSDKYQIMQISELIDIARESISGRFGQPEFKHGENSHGYTEAIWTLPGAQEDLIRKYKEATKNAVSNVFALNFTPAVRFLSSDTAKSSAYLTPCIYLRGAYIPFVDGVCVKHQRLGDKGCMTRFQEEAGKIFALFDDMVAEAGKLSEVAVWHPENAVVGMCKRYGIPKKYGEKARAEVEMFRSMSGSAGALSAHDVYLAMSNILVMAEQAKATPKSMLDLREALAKCVKSDWKDFDVGGIVEW